MEQTVFKADGSPGKNGYFNEDGLCGMLEEIVISQLDNTSLLFVVLVDLVCGFERYCPVTDMFTSYIDILQFVCVLHGHYVMGPVDMSKWRADILTFENKKLMYL